MNWKKRSMTKLLTNSIPSYNNIITKMKPDAKAVMEAPHYRY